MQNKPAYHALRGTFGGGKADTQEHFRECPDIITPYLPPFGVVCGTVKDGKSMEGALVSTIFSLSAAGMAATACGYAW